MGDEVRFVGVEYGYDRTVFSLMFVLDIFAKSSLDMELAIFILVDSFEVDGVF